MRRVDVPPGRQVWELLVAVSVLLLAGAPVLLPVWEWLTYLPTIEPHGGLPRLFQPATNTVLLAAGTALGSVPLGSWLGLLLFRTDLPLRRPLIGLSVLAAILPLPVQTSAWQVLAGSAAGGTFWPLRPGQPWTSGLGPALWVHVQASVPWVILIVGAGACAAEPDLEEAGILHGGPWSVLWRVTWPRSRPWIIIASLWVTVQTAGEIAVTDMFQVRTLAEEVYLVFGQGSRDALARAAGAAVLLTVFVWAVTPFALPPLARSFSPAQSGTRAATPLPLGTWGWPTCAAVAATLFVGTGVPLAALAYRTGQTGQDEGWTLALFRHELIQAFVVNAGVVGSSVLYAALTAFVTSGLAAFLTWAGRPGGGWRWLYFGLCSLTLLTPGPVIGLGIKEVIQWVVWGAPQSALAQWLYFAPSPLPVCWAQLVRTLPVAAAILWASSRRIPLELTDISRLRGLNAWQEFWLVDWPLSTQGFVLAVVVCTALGLNEVAAAKLVVTPGYDTFTLVVFDRMHYGVTQEVAAVCLVLLGLLGLLGVEAYLRLTTLLPPRPRG